MKGPYHQKNQINKEGRRTLGEVMGMFIAWNVVMVLWVRTYLQTHMHGFCPCHLCLSSMVLFFFFLIL